MLKVKEPNSLAAAEMLRCPQTGMVHYNYEKEQYRLATIPLYANFLYALSLFRSRSVDNFKRGRELLDHLLAFEVDGGIPVYLNEYPSLRNRNWGINFLPIIFWMQHDYQKYLGETLSLKLKNLTARILARAEKEEIERPIPKKLRSKILAFHGDISALDWDPISSEEWGYYLICIQMLEAQGHDVKKYYTRCGSVWNPELGVFVGDISYEKQHGYGPKMHFFHLAMSHYTNKPLELREDNALLHLQGALFRESEQTLQFSSNEKLWFSQIGSAGRSLEIKWENFSFALENFDGEIAREDDGSYLLTLSKMELPHDRDHTDVELYLSAHDSVDFRVEGEKATVFDVGEEVQIKTGESGVCLQFEYANDDAVFMGHLAKGNRDTQDYKAYDDLCRAYDWKIFLRSIRRPEKCRIRMRISAIN